MVYDKPIVIQVTNDHKKTWQTFKSCHAHVRNSSSDEYAAAGAQRSTQTLEFRLRYFSAIKDLLLDTQKYRIVYQSNNYNITSYEDIRESHREVKLTARSYG